LRDQARAFGVGGIDFVVKPFDPLQLVGRVQTILERIDSGERDSLRAERLAELRELLKD
jgi:PleD family two-component response regulator